MPINIPGRVMDGFDFPVEIIRTDRKRSASIFLDEKGVRVRVPKSLSDHRIHELICKKTPWIKRKLRETALRAPVKPREYVSGEAFSYTGRNYRLKVTAGDACAVKLTGGYLQVTIPDSADNRELRIRALLTDWYVRRAQPKLLEKTQRYAADLRVSPKSVTIKDYKSRWGSCSPRGDISYNWRIIMAPHRIIDYVVVHELCHILEHNHSRRYWDHVGRILPDYRDLKGWLKEHARRLDV